MIRFYYASNDEKTIGEEGGCEYTDTATMVVRSVYQNATGVDATKETTSQIAATRGTNNL